MRARLSPRGLLANRLVLRDLEVVAPRLTIRLAVADELAAGLAASLGEAGRVSLRGLVVTEGTVRLEPASGAGGLVLRDVAAPASGHAYVVRLRARDVDVAALQRSLAPAAAAVRVDRARADVDAELVSGAGRTFLSGRARLQGLVARAPAPSVSPLRADEVVVAVDRFDVAARAGRLARLELRSPSLTIRLTPEGVAALRRGAALLPDVAVRRLRIRDGAVTLVDRRRRPLPGGASLMSALVEIADAVEIALAD